VDKLENEYSEADLSTLIMRLTEKEHPKIIGFLREIGHVFTDNKVKQFEENDQVISKFLKFKNDLTEHIELEDYVVFPKIMRAIRFGRSGLLDIKERLYASELTDWIAFHNIVSEELDALITINNIVDMCNLHQLTGNHLRDFENLLKEHAKFEDEVLFPTAIKLAVNDLG